MKERKYNIGTRVIINSKNGDRKRHHGEKGTVTRTGANYGYGVDIKLDNGTKLHGVGFASIKLLNNEVKVGAIESISKEIEQFKAEIAEAETKLEYLNAMGIDAFDEREFKIWKAIRVLNTKGFMTEADMVKAIADITK